MSAVMGGLKFFKASSCYGRSLFILKGETMLVKKLKETFEQYDGQSVTLQGWVRTNRNSKAVGFIALNDGTTFAN